MPSPASRPARTVRVLAGAILLVASCTTPGQASPPNPLHKINHLIVIYQENWSFDSLYPYFPGAENLNSPEAAKAAIQLDKSGNRYTTLPQPTDTNDVSASEAPPPDPRFPGNLPVAPFDAAKYVPPEEMTGDLVHRFYQEQYQIDGGRMDRFVAWSDAAGLAMSYYDATNMPEGKLAQRYVMADHFFHSAFGGSFLNHFWLICACTPRWTSAPPARVAVLDETGALKKDGAVTPDGYAINTLQSVNQPHSKSVNPANLLPNQDMPNIGDRLSARNVSWAWYSGGWNDALAGNPDQLFQFHHQPFVYFSATADGTAAKNDHLKDEKDFQAHLQGDKLPAVSFIKPLGPDNEHPAYANLTRGQQHVANLVSAIHGSRYWRDSAIVITYDENGGRWDHVPPPKGDRWGPGTRVPTIIISPFSRERYVDHTQYDTTSILAFIEHRWDLSPLGDRDAVAQDLSNAFDFSRSHD